MADGDSLLDALAPSATAAARRVLNVGGNNKQIPIPNWYAGWDHLLLDIDPTGNPDICCDARTMTELDAGQFDAIYCSHNLEHFYLHDVPKVLAGFRHVLRADGFAEIRVPDIGMVFEHVVAKGLDIDDPLYTANIGPILVRDVLYGLGSQIERSGVDFYAHRTGFTKKSMQQALSRAGFQLMVFRPGRNFELFVLAFKSRPTTTQQSLLGFTLS